MSLSRFFKSVGRALPGIATGFAAGGPAGALLGGLGSIIKTPIPTVGAMTPSLPSLPGTLAFGPMVAGGAAAVGRMLPSIGAGVGIGAVARAGGALVTRGARGAMTLCRRHPQWCATIGGTAAVAALIDSGQLPPPRRSRARGISARELRSFKRVSRTLSKFCAPTKRAMRAPAMRGRKCP